jgi:uncharacterized protein YndB with AHSA1/START domain
MDSDVVSVERVIPAPAAKIFALVADPTQHSRIDGSGALRQVGEGAPHRLALGDQFAMGMKQGVPYRMVNTVVELEPDRRIAWKTTLAAPVIGPYIGGRIWRYELDEVDGGTRVTESWDISEDRQRPVLRRGRLPAATAANMARSLERIEEIVTTE